MNCPTINAGRPTLDEFQATTRRSIVRELRERAEMTQAELANEAGVSTLLVIRAEQSLHTSLSASIAEVLSVRTGMPITEIAHLYEYAKNQMIDTLHLYLTEDYINYGGNISAALEYAVDQYVPMKETVPVYERNITHPFFLFRTRLFSAYGLPTSAIKFCTYTGLHPAILSALEKRMTTIDKDGAVWQVMRDVLGLSHDVTMMLKRLSDDCI